MISTASPWRYGRIRLIVKVQLGHPKTVFPSHMYQVSIDEGVETFDQDVFEEPGARLYRKHNRKVCVRKESTSDARELTKDRICIRMWDA